MVGLPTNITQKVLHKNNLLKKIVFCINNTPNTPPVIVVPGAKDLIEHLLVVDKKRRYSSIDVLCHPWILCGGDVSGMDQAKVGGGYI